MAYEKELCLLSDSLLEILNLIKIKYDCPICKELLEVHNKINLYNIYLTDVNDFESSVKSLYNDIHSKITNEARMLSLRSGIFEISYLPKGKNPIYSSEGIWSRENRKVAKPARIIQKLLKTKFSCKEYENFSNYLKSEIITAQFKIVEGEDIAFYYNSDHYFAISSTLGNSCMRHDKCQDYFELYVDEAKMLITLKGDKITGRAILWEIGGKTYMDRVYTCYDYLIDSFYDYAKKNKWIVRNSNCLLHSENIQLWLTPDDNYNKAVSLKLIIPIKSNYNYFPYLDSFRYYNGQQNYITTDFTLGEYTLDDTEGSYNKYYIQTCPICGRSEMIYSCDAVAEGFEYSNYDGECYCQDCCVYCEGIDDYVSVQDTIVDVYVDINETQEYPLDYLKTNSDFVEINHVWYSTDYPFEDE